MTTSAESSSTIEEHFQSVISDSAGLIDEARRCAVRSVNAIMTAAYWQVGRFIVEFEQAGEKRAEYRTALIERLATVLTDRFGRGFSRQNIWQMRLFYQSYPPERILQTPSGECPQRTKQRLILQTPSGESLGRRALQPVPRKAEGSGILPTAPAVSSLADIASRFPLPWSAYVRLLSVKNLHAREFYATEALRGGWSVRQLDRQINSQFYERTALSKDKASLLTEGYRPRPDDALLPEDEVKDPYVLEFLGLKDEYSESTLEEALIRSLETFLLELGGDFCFMGRQRRLRIGSEWYRVDLLFYNRRLRCLVVIDLKIGRFTHADAGQMHLYLNYAREHWVHDGENPPVGLILCAQKDEAVARYALDGLPNKVMAAEYRTTLPNEDLLALEIDRTREALDARGLSVENKDMAGPETLLAEAKQGKREKSR